MTQAVLKVVLRSFTKGQAEIVPETSQNLRFSLLFIPCRKGRAVALGLDRSSEGGNFFGGTAVQTSPVGTDLKSRKRLRNGEVGLRVGPGSVAQRGTLPGISIGAVGTATRRICG